MFIKIRESDASSLVCPTSPAESKETDVQLCGRKSAKGIKIVIESAQIGERCVGSQSIRKLNREADSSERRINVSLIEEIGNWQVAQS